MKDLLNSETLKGTLDRAILVGITWLLTQAVTKGYLPASKVADLAPALALVVGTGIAYFVNRPGSLAAAAEKTGSVVISPPAVAEAADRPNVLPTTATMNEITSAVKEAKAGAIVSILLVGLLLGACVQTTKQQPPVKTGAAETISAIQEYVAVACRFRPYYDVVSAIYTKLRNKTVSEYGAAICEALATNPMAEGPGGRQAPKVAGVAIRGQRL